jgi:hypothetical protein
MLNVTPTTTGVLRPPSGLRLKSSEVLVAGALTALLLYSLTTGAGFFTGSLAIAALVVAIGVLGANPRVVISLAVVMLYIGLLDGYLKLQVNSHTFVLIRDALLYAIVAGVLIRTVVQRRDVRLPPLTGWVAAWVVIVLVELLNPANGTLSHSVQALRPHLEFVPLFFFGFFLMRTSGRLRGFLMLLVLVAAVNGVVNVIQFNLTPDQLTSWGPGYAKRIHGIGVSGRSYVDAANIARTRPFGLGSDIGFGGVTCLLAAAGVMALLYRRRGTVLALAIPAIVVVALGVVTSQARVVVVGSIFSVIAFLAMTSSPRRWVGPLATVAVTATVVFLAVGSVADSTNNSFERYRSIAPEDALRTTYDYRKNTFFHIATYGAEFPLGAGLGSVGPGNSTPGGNGRALDGESQYTFLLVETGIGGLIALVGFNLLVLSMVVRRLRTIEDRGTQVLLAAIAAPLFALVGTWVVGASTAGTPSSPYMWFAAGILVYWLHERSERSGAAPV